ncbi:MAG: GNAT family N-acetyltransferase [Syntrophomonadaceae bacterium]|nr:GNAT family N-acetyltransferase [Syntrophomonadaceae bacterium]
MPEEYLRKVDYSDMELLYEWANEPETRTNSFNSALISFQDHKIWFEEKINSPQVLFFIYHYESKDIGQLRLDIKHDAAIITYSVDFLFRGKGHGRRMLTLAERKVQNEYPEIKYFQAQVKYQNNASLSVFRRLNYTEHRETEFIGFVKLLPSVSGK